MVYGDAAKTKTCTGIDGRSGNPFLNKPLSEYLESAEENHLRFIKKGKNGRVDSVHWIIRVDPEVVRSVS